MSFSRQLFGAFNATTDVIQYIFAQIVLWILILSGLVFGCSEIFASRFESAHKVVIFTLTHPWWTVYPALIAMLYLVVYWILDRRSFRELKSKE